MNHKKFPRFSVILPVLNEEDEIGACLEALPLGDKLHEILVVDGGSQDRTEKIVSTFAGVRWVASSPGRGRQMNAGARLASGEFFIFLHADTRLPEGAFDQIEDALTEPAIAAGSFKLEFQPGSPLLRLFGWMSGWNQSLMTFGDQAFFIRRQLFHSVGGFRDIPICEDVEFQSRIRRLGRWRKIRDPAVTSSRRFMKNGPFRQQLKNILIVGCFLAGVDPNRLHRWYGGAVPLRPKASPRDCLRVTQRGTETPYASIADPPAHR